MGTSKENSRVKRKRIWTGIVQHNVLRHTILTIPGLTDSQNAVDLPGKTDSSIRAEAFSFDQKVGFIPWQIANFSLPLI